MSGDKPGTIRLTRREALHIGLGLCAVSTQIRAEEAPRPMPAKDNFADTPPMGWNTSGSYGLAGENEEMVKRGVDTIIKEGLKDAGYTVVLIDYGWYQDEHGTTTGMNPLTRCDAFGYYVPNADRFPQGFKPLADYIHARGMKFGLHLMRGVYRGAYDANLPVKGTPYHACEITDTGSVCGWSDLTYGLKMEHPGAQTYLDSLFDLFAEWGVDFLKIDDLISPYHAAEIEGYHRARMRAGRPIIISGSPGDQTPLARAAHLQANMEMYRITKDQWDTWSDILVQFERAAQWAPYCGRGTWMDLDALPFGMMYDMVRAMRIIPTRFTPDEIRTTMTLHCIARSPLVFYADPLKVDPFTKGVLTNADALRANKYGSAQRQLYADTKTVTWISTDAENGSTYLALFNLLAQPSIVEQSVVDLGFERGCSVRDIWQQSDRGSVARSLTANIPGHGVAFYVLSPP